MSTKLIRVISLSLLLLTLNVATDAQRGRNGGRYGGRYENRWEVLGQARVDGRADHDRINVNSGETYRAIQLGIKGGTINFQRVVVHFENGTDFELAIQQRINAGGKTRQIDLPGERRRIRDVEFWYGKTNWRSSRPTLNLWGMR